MNSPAIDAFMAETADVFIQFFERSGCPLSDEQLAALAPIKEVVAA